MSFTIGITGAYGFLGWHMRCYLHTQKQSSIKLAGRETFQSNHKLEEFVRDCDVIFHFAGVNRSENQREISEINPSLAENLTNALDSTSSKPFIVYSSTTHIDSNNIYGEAKQRAGEILKSWADRSGGEVANIVFPHLYGECGRPFYNSVVHTFCHQLANGEELSVNGDGQLQLLHAQDAVEYAWQTYAKRSTGVKRPAGRNLTVTQLAEKLRNFHASYIEGVVPDLRDAEDRKLFNVLRTAMFPGGYPVYVKRNEDPRGWLFEAIREKNGGQIFISSTNPGYIRGNHYHRFKVERFCVLQGTAIIRIRKLFSNEIYEFQVSGEKPCFIDMPPLHTHSIENCQTSDVITLFWADEFFDPDKSDTFPETVVAEWSKIC